MKHFSKVSFNLFKSPRRLLLLFVASFTLMVGVANLAPVLAPAVQAVSSTSVPDQSANDTTNADCDAQLSFDFSWALCPIFDAISGGAEFLFRGLLQPFLIVSPISTDSNNPSFQIWSSFRIYGNIFLVIALLVVVFGQSIGGGLVDAYTAKKVLPRILAAAILINLSIYIVAFAVDVTNIVGKGLGQLMTAPIAQCEGANGQDCWVFDLSVGDGARVFAVGLIGLLATGPALTGFVGTLVGGGLAGPGAIITVLFFVMLPVLFAIIGVFFTLVIRQGLLLILIMLAPVAFALYCLPNTERYFKKWWELLTQTLLVYPIIVAIFGAADLLTVTLLQANGITPANVGDSNFFADNVGRTLALVVAFLLTFIPLLLIPFSFRFAGGLMKRAYEAATGAGAQIDKLAAGRREQAKKDYKSHEIANRARAYHRAQSWGESSRIPRPISRRVGRFAANRAGGYNIEALSSAQRAEVAKQLNDQIATGRDEEIRGLTVNKNWAASADRGPMKLVTDANGNVTGRTNDHMLESLDANGNVTGRKFRSLGGAWVSEQDVDAGQSRWAGDHYAQQAALSYEMRKALNEDDVQNIAENYHNVAQGSGGWGMSRDEAGGAWIGAAFENQNTHLQYKNTNWETGRMSAEGAKKFVEEVYNKKGSYPLAQMHSGTIKALRQAHDVARANGDTETQQRVQSVAETFMSRYGARGGNMVRDGEGNVQGMTPPTAAAAAAAAAGGVSEGNYQVMSSGAGSVNERVRELAVHVGVYDDLPDRTYSESSQLTGGPNPPRPPDHKRQN